MADQGFALEAVVQHHLALGIDAETEIGASPSRVGRVENDVVARLPVDVVVRPRETIALEVGELEIELAALGELREVLGLRG